MYPRLLSTFPTYWLTDCVTAARPSMCHKPWDLTRVSFLPPLHYCALMCGCICWPEDRCYEGRSPNVAKAYAQSLCSLLLMQEVIKKELKRNQSAGGYVNPRWPIQNQLRSALSLRYTGIKKRKREKGREGRERGEGGIIRRRRRGERIRSYYCLKYFGEMLMLYFTRLKPRKTEMAISQASLGSRWSSVASGTIQWYTWTWLAPRSMVAFLRCNSPRVWDFLLAMTGCRLRVPPRHREKSHFPASLAVSLDHIPGSWPKRYW